MTNAQPLVSVVIPVYNMQAFLPDTLDSVLASEYPHLEVIVMDDGSTDGSLAVARDYAARDVRVQAFTQPNAGVCVTRNRAIARAKGEFILPVDADNLITPRFIPDAVAAMLADWEVKVVAPRADFFGDRTGEWKLPPFSIHLLARKNIMDTCALYRKADWERVGGYCEEIIAREDWEFWISVLENGGKVVRLPEIALHYRIRHQSKRVTDRQLKRHVIDVLNRRHPEFFERELGGPMHYRRTWSRLLNRIDRWLHPGSVVVNPEYQSLTDYLCVLPRRLQAGEGKVIYKGRNELREVEHQGVVMVVKLFRKPNFINRWIYGIFRPSKAHRSYEYALMLQRAGIGTPAPVGYVTRRSGFLFSESYYACLKSECPYTYADLVKALVGRDGKPGVGFPHAEKILRAIARTTARLHECGYLHKDYSRGNILFRELPDGEVQVEVIDLNRIRFRRVDMEEGCRNFERLPGNHAIFTILADEYARVRGFDVQECLRIIEEVCKEDIYLNQ